ncbi:MAG TPA: hypothetical protein PKD91_06695 [Bacteroidia bacterium]|nr:hypothetical protein [Bacteroidia bacterium]
MKFYSFALVLLCLIVFVSGCKYEDGPGISFRSACKRVEGNYTIEKFEVNGNDSLGVFIARNCNGKVDFFDISKINGNISIHDCRYSGKYDLRDNNRKIVLQFEGDTSDFKMGIEPWEKGITHTWDIVELKDKSMTFETTYNGNLVKIGLVE